MLLEWLFRNKWLASVGLTDSDDQYVFYGAIGAGVGKYALLSYKNYLLREDFHSKIMS